VSDLNLGFVIATPGDLLRLVVLPVFAWAAIRDVRTRRVPNRTWYPLVALGAGLLALDGYGALVGASGGRLFFLQVGVSLGVVVPLVYLFWRLGGFGGADAKALMTLAVLTPTYPAYLFPAAVTELGLPGSVPVVRSTVGVFSFTALTNAALLGVAYPAVVFVRNLLSGRLSKAMFLGRPVAVSDLSETYGRLFEDTAGETTRGVDLDALRMYLRWRGTTLSTLRADPDRHRDPASITETRPPGDGNVDRTLDIEMERTEANPVDGDPDGGHDRREDPWGADRFADEVGTPYGTTPEVLREGLETVTRTDEVWVSPGLPFMVPLFFGLVTAFTIGDVFFASLGLFGAV
jgi:preflagellin peptidase FlaK